MLPPDVLHVKANRRGAAGSRPDIFLPDRSRQPLDIFPCLQKGVSDRHQEWRIAVQRTAKPDFRQRMSGRLAKPSDSIGVTVLPSAFDVLRLPFDVLRSAFDVLRSASDVRRSTFGVRV